MELLYGGMVSLARVSWGMLGLGLLLGAVLWVFALVGVLVWGYFSSPRDGKVELIGGAIVGAIVSTIPFALGVFNT